MNRDTLENKRNLDAFKVSRTPRYQAAGKSAVFLLIIAVSVAATSCARLRQEPTRNIDSYQSVTVDAPEDLHDAASVQAHELGFTVLPLNEGDADMVSRTLRLHVDVTPSFLSIFFGSAEVRVSLYDLESDLLIFRSEASAHLWSSARARALDEALDMLRPYYHGFNPAMYEVRKQRTHNYTTPSTATP